MTESSVDLELVPAQRLGRVLREARLGRGLDHAAVAERAGPNVSAEDLAAAEDGDLRLSASEVGAVATALGIGVGELVPARAELVIDLDAGTIAAGDGHRTVGGEPDEILTQYLALVYTLRGNEPGTSIPLRDVDLDVLSQALQLESTAVRERLVTLMIEPPPIVSERTRLLTRKGIVPAAGILVGATAIGALVFVLTDGPSDTADTGNRVGSAVVVEADVELLPPLVAERDAEGNVTVRERTAEPEGSAGAPSSSVPAPAPAAENSVELIPPLVVERGGDVGSDTGESAAGVAPSEGDAAELIPPLVVERGGDPGAGVD